jgi:DNA-binding MarR family transcriptional regulator
VKSKVKVIEIIGQNPSVTIPEIAASLGMSIPGIEKIIQSLKRRNDYVVSGPIRADIGRCTVNARLLHD